MKARFLRAAPYADDALALPVADVASAVPYYERIFNFRVVSRSADPHASAIMTRDDVTIGLAENGGDPTQEGCVFDVDDLDAAFAELTASGAKPSVIKEQNAGGSPSRAFFVIAPDGLCYMLSQKIDKG